MAPKIDYELNDLRSRVISQAMNEDTGCVRLNEANFRLATEASRVPAARAAFLLEQKANGYHARFDEIPAKGLPDGMTAISLTTAAEMLARWSCMFRDLAEARGKPVDRSIFHGGTPEPVRTARARRAA